MWTNVFKIGGLNQISWFQFLPHESEFSSLADKSAKIDQKDAGAMLVLSSHLQLQNEGLLSTWTNSFVGPWDPSQGLHNPDEKIKLWLFLPGHHSSIVEKAKPALSHLRVLGSGLWVAPGESEEVATALSQALKNRIERTLRGYSYIRFGDVFSRYHPSPNEELSRKGQPVLEFVFAATEEAIFVHVMISAKHVRALSSGDIEAVFHQSTKHSAVTLPVLVSPNGMHGRLTGCCPNDLVKQVYLSSGKLRANEVVGLENQVSQESSCQLRGQNCYAEVTIGCPDSADDKLLQQSLSSNKDIIKQNVAESPVAGNVGHGCLRDQGSLSERVFIYPVEAVIVPVMQTAPTKSYLKRFWLQNWIGPSLSGTSIFMHCNRKLDYQDSHDLKSIRSQFICHSSSNSNSSSISNITSSSSKTSGSGDLDADADSLACRQSGLSSVGQSNNNTLKSGSKRTRAGMSDSFSQLGTVMNPPTNGEVNNSTITESVNDPTGRQYGWDDDEPGVCMDIQTLLTEFGDFGDFFENDMLPFGEPPGTAESQALISTTPDCGDVGSSPCTSIMDVSDQMLMPIGMTSLGSLNPPPQLKEDSFSMIEEALKSGGTASQADGTLTSINSEFDHFVKAEVMMTFAPEYGAVETPNSEVSSSIFRSPYVPNSRRAETATSSSNNYIYSAKPPSQRFDGPNEKSGSLVQWKAVGRQNFVPGLQLKQYYTHVESGRDIVEDKLSVNTKVDIRGTVLAAPSFYPGSNYTTAVNSFHTNIIGDPLRTNNFFPLAKSVLASEVECIMYQAFMCKIRHTLFSSSSSSPVGLTRSPGSMVLNRSHGDPNTTADHNSGRYEVKKQEQIPARIAGDIGGGSLDGGFNTPVGVWRSVGVPRTGKPAASNIEVGPSVQQYSFLEESMLSYGLRQPLHEFLDGMALLVQQGTSFVDLALDADCTDGPFSWLALQEQWRRGFCCGPSKVHAGCGGMLSSSHSLDISGVELVDPYSVDVQASLTISLLQSDIKLALKSAFGTLDGPLSISDWCRGRSLDAENMGDGFSAESTASHSEDGTKMDETGDKRSYQEACASESEHQSGARVRPTLAVVPFPAILVGYQDDWLKCSASSLKFWEKAPFEPYATQKHMSYYVVCPHINPLTTAAADFFQQLGTVYETCKLGVHSPQSLGNEMDTDSGKSSSGFVLLDCPQSMKIDSSTASMLGSISDYFLSLSNGWDVASFLKSLSKVLKTLKLVSCLTTNSKEGNSGACVVVYVVCPFPDPVAVLQTLIESSVALGSMLFSSDKEKRSMMHNQVGKALSHLAAVDETLSNVVALSGSNIPKLVLQIVTVDAIFRVTSPALNELTVLKEIAFTVYNKARRVSRGSSNTMVPPSSTSDRSHSALMHMTPPASGLWKDCIAPRVTGSSLQRESEVDSNLRATTWENSWQTSRIGGIGYDPVRIGDFSVQEEQHYMFEPLFILAEPGSLDRAVLPPVFSNMSESSRLTVDDSTSSNFMQSSASSGTGDIGMTSQSDATTEQQFASGSHKTMPSLHCCYGWTEDWRWLVCMWTDSRGELLDSYIYPFGGISGRQDTKGLQSLFIQILQQGCQILQACPTDPGFMKARDFVIARIGCFFEMEYQEWQKALYAVGGSEMKKWSLQLRRSIADGLPTSNNGTSSQQDIGIQERPLVSPSPLYNSHTKASSFIKGGLSQSSRKQIVGGPSMMDNSKGLHQWVHSICFVSISVDHSLQLLHQADLASPGTNQGSGILGQPSYLEGYTPVKSLGSTSASYVFIPSPSLRFLPPSPLQLPTCLTAESPPLAHLLHSKGSAIPLSTGFVVSKAVPSMRKDPRNISKEEWPSVLSVGLVDYYGSNSVAQEKYVKNGSKLGGKSATSESRDVELEAHLILECVAAELHALSWMTASPLYLERRSALPFHCDMVLRLRRLLYFADKELSKQSEKSQV